MQHDAINEREDCRVHANCQRQRRYRRCRESRRFEKLSQRKLEILGHEELRFVLDKMQPAELSDSTSLVEKVVVERSICEADK